MPSPRPKMRAKTATAPGMGPTPFGRRENHGSHPWPAPAADNGQDHRGDQGHNSAVGTGSSPSTRLGLSPTQAERRILRLLVDREWHTETELRASFALLQRMYLRGLLYGAMRTTGGTPDDRLWRARLVEAQR